MHKYFSTYIRNCFNNRISKFALVDASSVLSEKSKVNRFCRIIGSKIDDFTYVSPFTNLLYASIGKYCSIGSECEIGMAYHSIPFISTSPIFSEKENSVGFSWTNHNIMDTSTIYRVVIGNDVWIGSNVLVPSSVSIGDGAIIGAGSIVTKDVPPYSIVAGNPAHIIRSRFSKTVIDMLLTIKWWNLPEEILKSNISLFQKKDFSLSDLKILEKYL